MKLTGSRCQCSACGEYFNRSSLFDRHRVGSFQPRARRCLSPDEMSEKGWRKNSAGFWVGAGMPMVPVWKIAAAANADEAQSGSRLGEVA